jgi:hypothetical protein
MADDSTAPSQDSSGSEVLEPLSGALLRVVSRLREPPLLFALGVLIILAIVAAVSVDGLALLWIPAVCLTVIALAAWLIPLVSTKGRHRGETRVRLRGKDVAAGGVVMGIDGLPVNEGSDIDVDMKVKRVKGRAVGLRTDRGLKNQRGD